MSKELRIYVLINSTLKMTNGKIISQVSHGISDVTEYLLLNDQSLYKQYKSYGQPKIILKCPETLLKTIYDKYKCFAVFDAGLTQVPTGSLTCLVFQPMIKSQVPDEFETLRLY